MKFFTLIAMLSCATAFAQMPTDAEIRRILQDRVGAENHGAAIVVGLIDTNGRRVVAYGSLAKDDARKPGGDTVFEIGSVTKVFTSLLLMDMVRRGEVALDDPIAKYLPSGVKVPERNGRKITLADVSTQSSGLPRMPSNFTPKDSANPYADYTVQQMYDFVSGYQLTRDIGSQYEYSNLAVGLLGHALSLRAGKSYEALVRERVCDPLSMSDTRITLTPGMKARLAIGHTATLEAVPNWDLPTLAGAGALRSTVNDMLTFLAANLGFTKTPLAQAMADEVSIRKPAFPGMEIAYAWHVETKDGSSIIWHNGGTGGYRSYIGFDPKARTGVVVLTNVSTPAGPDDIGKHLLNAKFALQKSGPPVVRNPIKLDSKVFDRYTGNYQLAPSVFVGVTRDGEHFYMQLTGQPKVEVFAESDTKFFMKVVDAQVDFGLDAQGAATQLTIHQNGLDMVAKRLTDDELQRAKDPAQSRKPSPGTEAAIRRSIQELQKGEPNYELMSAEFAQVARPQMPQLKTMMDSYGALKSVTFKGVGVGGLDIYEVEFEHAKTEWKIILGPDGKTLGMGFRPL